MTIWRKSSHSGTQGGTNCVEVAELPGRTTRTIAVRDSKNPGGPKLHLTPTQWSALLSTIKTSV
ncbi:MAG TPA: DUF397 domain-containing protein [Streptosporangiaceae bacterium]